ncbi:MAG: hypothetical protein ABIJ20_01195 [Nanoarchaeota archaeon]|nr:hypothetical protein [Nanoarchaeota archaeon]MBU1444988.1 hypothetical protein [Nanoarchaeota archaeon]MBU2406844.1 hypothetical protein [Nanoarchaeota archaeon]MBU2420844.1 hypothetical protein [Nanoarchaeota archaeon]MBU2475820.1 hypothetical protein [Nanoarchaeota archaeon]
MDEIKFLVDDTLEEREKLLKDINELLEYKPVDQNARFLRDFTYCLIKASSGVKPVIDYTQVQPFVGNTNVHVIQKTRPLMPLRFNLPKVRLIPKGVQRIQKVETISRRKKALLNVPKPIQSGMLDDKLEVKNGDYYYNIKGEVKPNEFREMNSLVQDGDVKTIYFEGIGKPILVDYKNKEKVHTKIFLKDLIKTNKMIINIAKKAKTKINKKEPFFDFSYKDMRIQGNLGTKFASPKLVMKKL